jgi:hypothetical protein
LHRRFPAPWCRGSFNGKIINKDEKAVKKENRAKGKGLECVFWRKWDNVGLDFTN